MSGQLRFWVIAFVLPASLSTSPASSGPFADLFDIAPRTATAPASAKKECLPRPGKSTADSQHWVYRLDGRRKCWFQAAEGIATVKKPVRHHAAEHRVAAPAENETARLKQEAVADARAELLRSPPRLATSAGGTMAAAPVTTTEAASTSRSDAGGLG
jgi:hypothetical protein